MYDGPMAVDYRVLEFRSSTPLSQVGVFSRTPPTLEVRGRGFKDVVSVQINGVPSPEFIVLSPTRLLAQIPSRMVGSEIRSVSVFSADGDEVSTRSVILFKLNHSGLAAEGRIRMVQSFLKRLLTTRGSDIFRPQDGGDLLALLGTAQQPGMLKAAAATSVNEAAAQEIQAQSRKTRLLPSERLRAVSLLAADFEPRTGTLAIRIRLTAVDGTTTDAAINV